MNLAALFIPEMAAAARALFLLANFGGDPVRSKFFIGRAAFPSPVFNDLPVLSPSFPRFSSDTLKHDFWRSASIIGAVFLTLREADDGRLTTIPGSHELLTPESWGIVLDFNLRYG